jgi:hypothetical protein
VAKGSHRGAKRFDAIAHHSKGRIALRLRRPFGLIAG